jgi:Flp pilus assembly pilin Flp
MIRVLRQVLSDESGQDIAEYAVMAAVILVIVTGLLTVIGVHASQVFFHVANALH